MTDLPPTKLVKDVLDGMLGREVAVAPANALTPADTIGGVLAYYVDDTGRLAAVFGWDLSAAAYVGAAVALVPVGGAAAALEDQYLPENLLENLGEVCNVLASTLQYKDNPHVRLEAMFRPLNSAPDEAVKLLYALGHRMDLQIEIPGYGAGLLSLSMRY